ncbi:hypothetical protein M408DRAFT_147253 [Serendipita vermifera MAFF 305830]|uniref:Uncharacterized protein n=1 Tax=Serendipita vermifera MAFF 305830 TaxID=933852 RepID=A0A0C3B984_SERVB|nr:hypothetical protein M408DRAFT_147253 [Serendipita vermifera MAFF 305830]
MLQNQGHLSCLITKSSRCFEILTELLSSQVFLSYFHTPVRGQQSGKWTGHCEKLCITGSTWKTLMFPVGYVGAVAIIATTKLGSRQLRHLSITCYCSKTSMLYFQKETPFSSFGNVEALRWSSPSSGPQFFSGCRTQ